MNGLPLSTGDCDTAMNRRLKWTDLLNGEGRCKAPFHGSSFLDSGRPCQSQ